MTGKKLLTTTLKLGEKAIQKQKLLVTALVQNSLNPDLKKFMIKLAQLPKLKELVNFGLEYMTKAMKENLFMRVMVKLFVGQIGTKGNQMIGGKERIVSEAVMDMEE